MVTPPVPGWELMPRFAGTTRPEVSLTHLRENPLDILSAELVALAAELAARIGSFLLGRENGNLAAPRGGRRRHSSESCHDLPKIL
jgi:hypothetical protein